MINKATSIDQFIASFPDKTQLLLQQLRNCILKAAPSATEKISYGIPTFYLKGNLVHFSGYKNHIGFYPGSSAIKAFEKQLANYKTSKGTVQFPIDKKLPLTLVSRIVKFRIKENEAKSSIKAKSK